MLLLLLLQMLLSLSQGEFTSRHPLNYDGDIYSLDLFVGSKLEPRKLVVDTMANGTAIDYNYKNSKKLS